MSFLMCRAVRHICTVSDATEMAATMARDTLPERVIRGPREEEGGTDADQDR